MNPDNQTLVMLPHVRPKRLQLVVEYLNGHTRWYPIPQETGWKIDVGIRQIVVGRGIPRTMIPLDTVAAYHLEEI